MVSQHTEQSFNHQRDYDKILALMSTDTYTQYGIVRTAIGRCDVQAYQEAPSKLWTPLEQCFEVRLIRPDGSRVFYWGAYSRSGEVAVAIVDDRYNRIDGATPPPPLQDVLKEGAVNWAQAGGLMGVVDNRGQRLFPETPEQRS